MYISSFVSCVTRATRSSPGRSTRGAAIGSRAITLDRQPPHESTASGLVFQIAMFIAIFYFAIIMPQQRRQKKRDETLKAVKRGDEVVTAGGIVGEVVHIRETNKDGGANRMDDRITIKSGESRLVVERGKIERVIGATAVNAASNNPPT